MQLNSNHEAEILKKFGCTYGIDLIKETFNFYKIQNFKNANGKPLLLKNVEQSLKELFHFKNSRKSLYFLVNKVRGKWNER